MSNASIETKRPAPGEPVIAMINWGGLRTLYIKEVRRFFKVQLQTIWGPAFPRSYCWSYSRLRLGAAGAPSWVFHSPNLPRPG